MTDSGAYIKPLLELFEGDLADVRFADVDAQTLTRAVGELDSADEELRAAQALLDAARAKLNERQEALLQAAHRALAYVRVYAEPDEALSARVNAIVLPRPLRKARAGADALVLSPDPAPVAREGVRPRGRPRKVVASDESPELLVALAGE